MVMTKDQELQLANQRIANLEGALTQGGSGGAQNEQEILRLEEQLNSEKSLTKILKVKKARH